jgi:hypothetical protein
MGAPAACLKMTHFTHFTPLFQIALLLVIPGALVILLVALLWTRR